MRHLPEGIGAGVPGGARRHQPRAQPRAEPRAQQRLASGGGRLSRESQEGSLARLPLLDETRTQRAGCEQNNSYNHSQTPNELDFISHLLGSVFKRSASEATRLLSQHNLI